MKLSVRFDKNLQKNAAAYYEKSKKAKKKLAGLERAVLNMEKKIESASLKKESAQTVREIKRKREKKWFEKFHWFNSSDGFLVIAGRDAKSNESLVKKHMEKTDVFFHAEIFGAPHTVIKTETKQVGEKTLLEAAQFAGIFSRAWKQKFATLDVYSAKPEQVSKKAPSGESIGTGAFMVYGKRDWFRKISLKFGIGLDKEGRVVSGPISAVKKNSKLFLEIEQGEEKKGSLAKKIKKIFEEKTGKKMDLDELVSMLPTGGVKIINE